jgi:tetratricopeptide (TPR) repeat protein
MDPTTDHAAVIRALGQVVGQRENTLTSLQFQLRPSELIDLSAELAQGETEPFRETTPGGQVARRECGESLPLECVRRLIQDVNGATLYYEGEATASVGTLRGLLREMGSLTGRKILVLVTGGMIASDRPGVRPDVSDLGHQAGREAALANTAVYTLHIDVSALEHVAAQTAAADRSFDNIARDSVLLGGWLDQFSGEAGGTLFKVLAGSGEAAYDRSLTETTAYYLLGVEVGDADRDGRTRQVEVKRRNLTVRGRKWVAIPKRGKDATGATPAEASSAPSTSSLASSAPRLATPRPLPRDVQTLADAFERGDWAGMERGLAETKNLANMVTGFRAADRPWPDAPRRRAVFALEIGLAGLRSDKGYAREEGSRLLAEYNTLVRQPGTGDVFECAWLWTQAAGLEGAVRPNIAAVFIARALQRCPNEPRLNLALAVVTEQQWLRNLQTSPAETAEVTRRYEQAMKSPETEAEACVRNALFLYRLGDYRQAIGLLDRPMPQSPDTYVRYLVDLVRGKVLHRLGRLDEAEAAFRAALATWPGAQSARISLMTLLATGGARPEAAALAEAVETAHDEQVDPWWTYWLGDARVYPDIIARLRELTR